MSAIVRRRFEPYSGEHTTRWQRRLVVPRFALREILSSRMALVAFVAGFIVPLVGAAMVYARQNATVLELFGDDLVSAIAIGTEFFQVLLIGQAWMTFVLALIIGPPLVARDMADNGLPLFLSRPISRADYILGKLVVLLVPLSAITWLAVGLVALFQLSFDGAAWWAESGRDVWATLLAFWALIVPLSLVTLALSAMMRRRWVARGLMLGAVFVSRGLAEAINGVLDTRWGYLISPTRVLGRAWISLYSDGGLLELTGGRRIPAEAAWAVLVLVSLLSLAVLWRRVRAYEEVRS